MKRPFVCTWCLRTMYRGGYGCILCGAHSLCLSCGKRHVCKADGE